MMQTNQIRYIAGTLIFAVIGTACNAGTPEPFLERGIARGINYPVDLGTFQFGSGLGMFDMDGDMDADVLVIGAVDGRVGLYENDGSGFFTDRTNDGLNARLAKHTNYSGVSAADYDSDGDLDIYLSRYGASNILYRNDGNWNFVDVSAASGLDDIGHSLSTSWADCNADGLLDVYVCNRTFTGGDPTENAFYENNGDGTFSERAVAVGIERAGDPTLVATFFDFDFDHDPDLYLGTDKGALTSFTNHFFENTGGVFANITAQTGTEANVDCMGIALGDIDRNGRFDMFLTNTPQGHVLLTGNNDGTFTDRSAESGAEEFEIGWGTAFFDFDNDAWEDLYIVQTGNARNALYRNPGSLPFENIGLAMNVATTGSSYCMSTADIDNDGDLDLLVSKQSDRIQLYINNEGSTRNWAKFDVIGQGDNTFAIGAQIRVKTDPMLPAQIREIRAGHHYKSQDPTTVHFGVDDAATLSDTKITWPNTTDSRRLLNYPANQTWTIYPPERIGDFDGNGEVDLADRQAILDRHVNANARSAEPIEPGIEMIDADGDADFDANDVLLIGAPCPSDVATPVGVLDLGDVNTFISGFLSQAPLADLTGEGVFDLADLGLFVSGFNGGCP